MRIVKLAGLSLLLMLAVIACGGSTPAATGTPGAAVSASPGTGGAGSGPSNVTISGFAFAPVDISVAAGTTVTWTNQDSATHTVTMDDGSSDSGRLGQGATYSLTFDAAGTFAYHCAIHPSMKGTVTVTP